jgi:ribonucleoside-diphosphate reductase alpha chain
MSELQLSENARQILEARYLKRDAERSIIETPSELFESVAHAVAHAELLLGNARQADFWKDKFLEILMSLDFLPNSPTLMNAGKALGQLSACFVLPVQDDMQSIFEAVKQMALVQRTGGGTGFSFSRLRPKGDFVASTSGEASGPVSFMKIFDCVTQNIRQGGKRRGANMGVLRVDHPDIEEFIEAKQDDTALQNFNISVAVTDAFMQTVEQGGEIVLRHPATRDEVGRVSACSLFDKTIEAAWKTGDPGLIFLDAVNRANPTPQLGDIDATNPCGEIPLLPYESCNLGSINLAHMLRGARKRSEVDWDKLRATTRTAVRFLDDVVEINRYPIAEIENITRGNRKIGLGVMGFAEMLIRLRISYASDRGVKLAEDIMTVIAEEALDTSRELAGERGVFPNWEGSIYETRNLRLRNAARTAIAPTGTTGIIADTTPGIEPLFALAYRRANVLNGKTLVDINPLFGEILKNDGLDKEAVVSEVMEKGRLADVADVPEELKRIFMTALEIPAETHLKMQAAFQRHVDNSVSKTINLPNDSQIEEVAEIYRQAWELGLKGITVYRYGSKAQQVLQLGVGEKGYQYNHASKCDPDECNL